MREPLKDKTRLVHILEAIERLEKYAGSLSREELEADVLRYYGIFATSEGSTEGTVCLRGGSRKIQGFPPSAIWDNWNEHMDCEKTANLNIVHGVHNMIDHYMHKIGRLCN